MSLSNNTNHSSQSHEQAVDSTSLASVLEEQKNRMNDLLQRSAEYIRRLAEENRQLREENRKLREDINRPLNNTNLTSHTSDDTPGNSSEPREETTNTDTQKDNSSNDIPRSSTQSSENSERLNTFNVHNLSRVSSRSTLPNTSSTTITSKNVIEVTLHDVATGDELPFELDVTWCISDLYTLFDEKCVKEPGTYYFACNGQVLHKSWSIAEANLTSGATIVIFPRQLVNVTLNGDIETRAQVSLDAFIGDFKQQLAPYLNKPIQYIQIYWNNHELKDISTFFSLGITTDVTLTIKCETKITVLLSYLGISIRVSLAPTATIQEVRDIVMRMMDGVMDDITEEKITVTFHGIECMPTQTLQELGVQHMDLLHIEVSI